MLLCRFGILQLFSVGSDGHGDGYTRPREADPWPAEQTRSSVESDCRSTGTGVPVYTVIMTKI